VDKRWKEIQHLWDNTPVLWMISGVLLGLLVGFLIGISYTRPVEGWFIDGFWPEAIGILVTVVVIDRLNANRDERRRLFELQERLVRQATGTSNEIAKGAIDELRDNGWLVGKNSILKRKKSTRANLEGVDLFGANLEETIFSFSNFRAAELSATHLLGTSFVYSDLENAKLSEAYLVGANFNMANLKGSRLDTSNLAGANLINADLSGCSLYNANLENALIFQASFDNDTLLPDGNYWTTNTDINRYTNPEHPDFWQPSWGKGYKYPENWRPNWAKDLYDWPRKPN
jgi:hypothetical protein